MNPMSLLQIMNAWKRFKENHPKFPKFLTAVYARGIKEGSRIEIKVTAPGGDTMSAAIQLKADDVELFREMEKMSGK